MLNVQWGGFSEVCCELVDFGSTLCLAFFSRLVGKPVMAAEVLRGNMVLQHEGREVALLPSSVLTSTVIYSPLHLLCLLLLHVMSSGITQRLAYKPYMSDRLLR